MDEAEKKARRASDAKRLLNDPILREALDNLRMTCFDNIESSKHTQKDEREDLYYMLRCITAFERELKRVIGEGQVSLHNFNLRKAKY